MLSRYDTLCLLVILYMYQLYSFFFFTDPSTTEISTLSLHDALPISPRRASKDRRAGRGRRHCPTAAVPPPPPSGNGEDRKSTRLNSSHVSISYAVFCLKKKKKK